MENGTRNILKMAGFTKEVNRVDQGLCPLCGEKVNAGDFKDALSFKEFTISGMCQKCQDEVFKASEENEEQKRGDEYYAPWDDD